MTTAKRIIEMLDPSNANFSALGDIPGNKPEFDPSKGVTTVEQLNDLLASHGVNPEDTATIRSAFTEGNWAGVVSNAKVNGLLQHYKINPTNESYEFSSGDRIRISSKDSPGAREHHGKTGVIVKKVDVTSGPDAHKVKLDNGQVINLHNNYLRKI
jgi:hypothetical protein